MSAVSVQPDPFDARRVRSVDGPVREFNDAGVLASADVHVAARLAAIAREQHDSVVLAAALAVRSPRLGHVHVDLASIRDTAAVDTEEPIDLSALPWPDVEEWVQRVAASELVAVGEADDGTERPLRLVGTWLYLDRYWAEEVGLARSLRSMACAKVWP